jgi:hypothetical protein
MKKYISKMTPQELFRQLAYMYINARKPIFYHPRITRGRSHTLASQVEDLFAYFLSLNLTENLYFLVDQPLNYGKKQLYPDISIVKDNVIQHVFDIKTDLGWNRDGFSKFCKDKQDKLIDFVGAVLSATNGVTKQKFPVKTGNSLQYHIVILSGLNISPEKLKDHLSYVERLSNIHAYVLFPKHHPNYYGDDVDGFISSVDINKKDFERIEKALTR